MNRSLPFLAMAIWIGLIQGCSPALTSEDRKYMELSAIRIVEIAAATDKFPTSILELANNVGDPKYQKWLTKRSDCINMPLEGKSYSAADSEDIMFVYKWNGYAKSYSVSGMSKGFRKPR